MRLVIQIPCYNEMATLPETLAELPRLVPGFDEVLFLVIDDGSTDQTAAKAQELGVDHIVRLPENRGLANAFRVGLQEALNLGADVIVNTDGDGQYFGGDIIKLVEPIVAGRADLVIGTRDIDSIKSFSCSKKFLQKVGSAIVRRVSGTGVQDATSGFRAFTREAALRLNVFSHFTYTLETLIQAGRSGLTIESVPVRTNEAKRASRLFSSNADYIGKSIMTMIRIYALYRPLQVFLALGGVFLLTGTIVGFRFLTFYFFFGGHEGHIQSLILAAILLIVGFQFCVLGLLADVLAANRRLLEETLLRVRRSQVEKRAGSSADGREDR